MARNGFKACKGIGFDAFRLDVDMGNYTKQIEVKKERKERDRTRREKLAGFFYDLAKITFAGLVIGVLSPFLSGENEASDLYSITIGIVLTILSAMLANKIMK